MSAVIERKPRETTGSGPQGLREQIRQRAQEIYRQQGEPHRSDLENWLQAEQEILRTREEAIDEAVMESFPASDPPSH